jgi:hypothetical protein
LLILVWWHFPIAIQGNSNGQVSSSNAL